MLDFLFFFCYNEIMKIEVNILYRAGWSHQEIGDHFGKTRGFASYYTDPYARLRRRIRDCVYRSQCKSKDHQKILDSILANPVCYLTGRTIDLLDHNSYELDHVEPVANGGKADLDNIRLAHRDANQAKGDLPYEDFLSLCFEILDNCTS